MQSRVFLMGTIVGALCKANNRDCLTFNTDGTINLDIEKIIEKADSMVNKIYEVVAKYPPDEPEVSCDAGEINLEMLKALQTQDPQLPFEEGGDNGKS